VAITILKLRSADLFPLLFYGTFPVKLKEV
jgi:hypothetical protein